MLTDKHRLEKDQNAQLRNQVAQLLHLEQDQKLQIQQRDSTIESLQVSKCIFICCLLLLLICGHLFFLLISLLNIQKF